MTNTAGRRPGRRAYLLASAFALALVLLPFLFWYDTWFGRRLTDAQIERYLNDKPRQAQHALVQIGERLGRGDASVRRWYPRIVELSAHASPELRQTAAWIMGQDTSHEPFRARLRQMLSDEAPLVRRNVALSLAAWRDPAGRGELHAMLRPFTVAAPAAGPVRYRLNAGQYVNAGTLLARVGTEEVRAPVPGDVRALLRREGDDVTGGQTLVELAPDETHAWEALRALYLVGNSADAEEVGRFVRGSSDKLQQQAALTLGRIRGR